MTVPLQDMFEDSRTALIQDQCALSRFVSEGNFSELDLLRRTIEELIQREETEEINQLAIHADRLAPDARSEFWADNHPYAWEDIIASQFRSSFFIALMSAVELHLGRAAQVAGMISRAPIGQEDLKGGFPGFRRNSLPSTPRSTSASSPA